MLSTIPLTKNSKLDVTSYFQARCLLALSASPLNECLTPDRLAITKDNEYK